MRYYTLQQWIADQDLTVKDSSDPSEWPRARYYRYLDSVRAALPDQALRLHGEICIEDGFMRDMTIEPLNQAVTINVDADDGQQRLRSVTLHYKKVTLFKILNSENSLSGPAGLGHLGYYELEFLEEGLFRHSLLFSSGIEIQIDFGDMELSVKS